ncbi:hypothetical protein OIU91_28135 [Streptomyces sp. NBC_01456]|uniref:hypothetical protein n=1 Tax=unclassified Streptomyces TaxID=2593676 RepID=UPI002E2F80BE|nr:MULTISPECIES: hypothetical protein [unclassified Streptomyces]
MSSNSNEKGVTALGAAGVVAGVLAAANQNLVISWIGIALTLGILGWLLHFFITLLPPTKQRWASCSFVLLFIGAITAALITRCNKPTAAEPWCTTPIPIRSSESPTPVSPAFARSVQESNSTRIDKVLVREQEGNAIGGCVKLDVSVRAKSANMVYIDLVQMHLRKIWTLRETCAYGGRGGGDVEISHNYDVSMSLDRGVNVPFMDVSQSIDGHDVDRFTITARLVAPPTVKRELKIVEAELEIYSDGATKPAKSQPFLFISNPDLWPESVLTYREANEASTAKENSNAVREVSKEHAERTERVADLIDLNAKAGRKVCPP